jgi:hypothetical protein
MAICSIIEAKSRPNHGHLRDAMGSPQIIRLLFLLLPLDAALASVQAQEEAKRQLPLRVADAAIVYRFHRGLDSNEEVWAIYSDGVIAKDQEANRKLLQNTVPDILDEIAKSGFFKMKGKYPTPFACYQCATYRITVRYVGKEKTVSFGDGSKEVPPKLVEIVSKIQGLLRNARTR